MNIITRHIVGEVLKVFFAVLGILTLLMIIFGLVRQAQEMGLEPRHVIRIVPYILPDSLRYTIPATILLAVTTIFGRMSGTNEIVALKSMGISPMAVLFPIFLLATFLSFATVWINDLAVSWGKTNVRRVVVESVEEIAYSMLTSQHSFTTPQFSIIVKGIEDRVLLKPIITFRGKGKQSVTLTAEEAELRSDTKAMLLTIVCRDGTLEVDGGTRLRFHGEERHSIPLDTASPGADEAVQPAYLPMGVIPEKIAEQEKKIAKFIQHRAAKAAVDTLLGDFAALDGVETRTEAEILKTHRSQLARLKTEPYRRWSNGFSCLCFVMIGGPLSIWWRYGDPLSSFFASFAPTLVVYYPLLAVGVEQSKDGNLPPISVWIGNVILFIWGYWLLRKVIRY
ncbi:MAG: LptF/LptG family permease [Planctomycetaceae bacterium]|nr:LptF/LptG family permease [Planctomycetaceae bacterium]